MTTQHPSECSCGESPQDSATTICPQLCKLFADHHRHHTEAAADMYAVFDNIYLALGEVTLIGPFYHF